VSLSSEHKTTADVTRGWNKRGGGETEETKGAGKRWGPWRER